MSRELDEDIVREITDDELREIFSNRTDDKIEYAIQQKNELGLKLQLICSKSLKSFKIVLLDNENNEKGYFSFDSENSHIGSGEPVFLSIEVDEDLRGKGFGWLLVGTLIGMIMNPEYKKLFTTSARSGSIGLNSDTILGIDADASDGFWDHIGLIPGRFTWDVPESKRRRLNTTESPFEKSITLGELSNKILNKSFMGGRRYKKYIKNKKTNKKQKKYTKNKKTHKKYNKRRSMRR